MFNEMGILEASYRVGKLTLVSGQLRLGENDVDLVSQVAFDDFVFATSASTGTVVSAIFGDAEFREFNADILALKLGTEPEDAAARRQRILQRCLNAYVAARATSHEVQNWEDFPPVPYIAFQAGRAAMCTPADIDRYNAWVIRMNSQEEALRRHAALIGDYEYKGPPDPRPVETRKTVPPLHQLGVEGLPTNAIAYAFLCGCTDILVRTGDRATGCIRQHNVDLGEGDDLVAQYDEAANHQDSCMIKFTHPLSDGRPLFVRASRESQDCYTFRMLRSDAQRNGPSHAMTLASS